MYKGELILGFQKYSNISNDKKSFRIITFDNLISRQHCLVDKKENCGRYKKLSLILKKVINPALAGNLSYFDLYLTSCIVLLCMMIMIPLLECSAQRQALATDHCLNYLRLHWQVVTGVEFGKCEVMKKFKPVMKNYEQL